MVAAGIDTERSNFHRDIARRAVGSTKKFLEEKLQEPYSDATLCHGFLGLSDILLTYARYNKDTENEAISRSFSARYLQHHNRPYEMQSGIIAGGYSPSLLIGAAGIGLHYLRLFSEKDIASALFFTP